jgi:hypothetical protein
LLHHTKNKGDIAAAKAVADLTVKGYLVFAPVVCEHLPFDLIAYKDSKCYRIQAKYAGDNRVIKKTIWVDKNGTHQKKYQEDDFDFYAIYLPDIDKVVYPSVKFCGCYITTQVPNSATPFYWWEDFTDFTQEATKRTYKEFGIDLTTRKVNKEARINTRKVLRPSKEELEKLLWEKPTSQIAKDFGLSDKAIEKWCKAYGIEKPPRGYWAKLQQIPAK